MTGPRPYRDDREHLLDELRRLDVLLRCRLEEWWAETDSGDDAGELFISDERIDSLLEVTDGGHTVSRSTGDPALRERAETLRREARERERATVEAGREPRLLTLADRFDIDRWDTDVLLLALAPELDRKYETVYGYLNDNVTRTRPTVDLALRVLSASEEERLAARAAFAPRSPLRRHRLIRLGEDRGSALLARSVAVEDRLVAFLLGDDGVDEELAGAATLVEPAGSLAALDVDAERRTALTAFTEAEGEGGSRPSMTHVHGPYGVGKRAAIEALCAERGTPVLRADAAGLLGDDSDVALWRLDREARLQGAAVAVENLTPVPGGSETDGGGRLDAVVQALDAFAGRVFLSGAEPLPTAAELQVADHEFHTLAFPRPSYERRRALWEAVDALPADVDPADLAAKFRLTGGQIADAVATAGRIAAGDPLSADDVYQGCRAQSAGELDSLARKVDPGYAWEDIVLPADEAAHLREVAAHVRHQGTVYADWGFAEKFSLGNGLTVLFSGPSGTGKTMAAEIIAGDAGLDLYKIDLASVVSKYIGETEKNLGRIFDAAEDSSAILLFDEADALFGKRSEVTNAHDRYANIEVNYLLQRIEEHDGTVLLTTNFEGNIDDAFRRRIHHHLVFPRPDRASREAIWRGIFPAQTPVGDLDFAFLSSVEMTGGNIKNTALTAAFLALEDGASVEMRHVVQALRREFRKMGKLIRPEEFGDYRYLLP